MRAAESLDFAARILLSSYTSTTDSSSTTRHTGAASSDAVLSGSSPKVGVPTTIPPPKANVFDSEVLVDSGGSAISSSSKLPKRKPHKKSRVERSKTFRKSEKDGGGGDRAEITEARILEQQVGEHLKEM